MLWHWRKCRQRQGARAACRHEVRERRRRDGHGADREAPDEHLVRAGPRSKPSPRPGDRGRRVRRSGTGIRLAAHRPPRRGRLRARPTRHAGSRGSPDRGCARGRPRNRPWHRASGWRRRPAVIGVKCQRQPGVTTFLGQVGRAQLCGALEDVHAFSFGPGHANRLARILPQSAASRRRPGSWPDSSPAFVHQVFFVGVPTLSPSRRNGGGVDHDSAPPLATCAALA
jgi:hypothetical protein